MIFIPNEKFSELNEKFYIQYKNIYAQKEK